MIPSDVGNYTIVPEWIVLRVSPRALQLHAILGLYRNEDGVCWPSRKTLAAKLDCALSTVDGALKELVDAGALEKRQRRSNDGDLTSSEYRLIYAAPGRSTDESGYGWTDESVIERGLRPSNEKDLPNGRSAERPKPRKRDVVFDALAEATSSDPHLEGSLIGKEIARLRGHPAYREAVERFGKEAADAALAEEIPRRAEAYRRHFGPDVALTAPALVKHWRRVAASSPRRLSREAIDRIYEEKS